LAVPVAGETKKAPARIALLQLPPASAPPRGEATTQLTFHPLPGVSELSDLQRGASASELLFSAVKDGQRNVFRLDTASGELSPAFDHALGPFDDYSAMPALNRLALVSDATLRLLNTETWETVGEWPHVNDAMLHEDGRFIMVEYAGDAVSVYNQRTWNELSDAARKREQAKVKRFEEELPEWVQRDVQLPTLGVIDLQTKKRWTFTAFQGDHLQWYTAAGGHWISFFIWGFEGKQFKRNIALVNMADRIRSIEEEREMLGVVPFTAPIPPRAEEPAAAPAE